MRVSTALAVSMLCFCWNSFTQLVTLDTISVAALRAASRACLAAPGFRWARSSRFTILTTFFSDIIFGRGAGCFYDLNLRNLSLEVPYLFNLISDFGKATFRRRWPRFGCRIIPPQPVFYRPQHVLPWLSYRFSRVGSVLGKLGGQVLECHIRPRTARPPPAPGCQTLPAKR